MRTDARPGPDERPPPVRQRGVAVNRAPSREWIGGATLIVIGLALLASQVVPGWDRLVVVGVGLLLLALFVVTRRPGALIPGGIITGIGVGIVLTSAVTGTLAGALFMGSLGGGFLLVALLGWLVDVPGTRWWPLIPGVILVAVGAAIGAGEIGQRYLRLAGTWWPVVLVALGAWMVVAAARSPGTHRGAGGTRSQDADGPSAPQEPSTPDEPGAG